VSQDPPVKELLVRDPQYRALKEYLISITGLSYYENKDEDLARHIQGRLTTLGINDCTSYFEMLKDPLQRGAELDALVAEITIGETYFFRHQEHFDALRDVVIPDLLARKHASRSLRIWCAGCAAGPEAYSLAILLKREFGEKLAGWSVSILGTDINQHSLACARQGKFSDWALRGTSAELKRECFVAEGNSWRIAPEYKDWISFRHHNLVEHPFPSPINGLCAFDLILCRNVMIYFGMNLINRIIGQFHDCLLEEAWLLVGPTEPNMTSFKAFQAVNAPGVTIYRKGAKAALTSTASERPAVTPQPTPPSRADAARNNKPVRPSRNTDPELAEVRRYADCGDWSKALACCERLLITDNLSSPLHFYHALVLEQMGRNLEAEAALRRAIYLDRRSVLPHYYLGLCLQSRSDSRDAARSFENAVALLEAHDDAEVFVDADGITVAEMKQLAKMQLEVLRS
jgi:chemotaxis protein methyltransferase CheR